MIIQVKKMFTRVVVILLSLVFLSYIFFGLEIPEYNHNQIKFLLIPVKDSPNRLLNLTDFYFIQNDPSICSNPHGREILLILVHSGRKNSDRRDILRKTIGTFRNFGRWEIRLVFLMGTQNSINIVDANHNHTNNDTGTNQSDVVIGNFVDSYRNLTYKHTMGYKWANNFCPNAKFILKMDDDVFVELFKLFDLIEEMESEEKWSKSGFLCNDMGGTKPVRTEHKSRLTFEEFSGENFPTYCSGFAYLVRTSSALEIYELSKNSSFIFIDDLWVTGILRERAYKDGIPQMDIRSANKFFFLETPWMKAHQVHNWYSNMNFDEKFPWSFVLLDWQDVNYQNDTLTTRMIKIWSKFMALHLLKNQLNNTISIENNLL